MRIRQRKDSPHMKIGARLILAGILSIILISFQNCSDNTRSSSPVASHVTGALSVPSSGVQNLQISTSANVRDFGAVGDGMTDDTQAFKKAIASLGAGGVLFVPQGH